MSDPAAFGRLCVETLRFAIVATGADPAAFGRLCVETRPAECFVFQPFPAAFGRLCVETETTYPAYQRPHTSRLRAAVC